MKGEVQIYLSTIINMLSVNRTDEWLLWIEEEHDINPYIIDIQWKQYTRVYFKVWQQSEEGKFIPYESVDISWKPHKLNDVYVNWLMDKLTLREILILNNMLYV